VVDNSLPNEKAEEGPQGRQLPTDGRFAVFLVQQRQVMAKHEVVNPTDQALPFPFQALPQENPEGLQVLKVGAKGVLGEVAFHREVFSETDDELFHGLLLQSPHIYHILRHGGML
jgi:hypothetical protein